MKADSYNPGRSGGNLEDIAEDLTILEPQETPFLSAISKGRCSATDPDVVCDTLRKPRTKGTREGDPRKGGNNKLVNRQRFKTQCQRFFDEWAVSDIQERQTKNGGNAVSSSDAAASKAKMILEHKRDQEATLLSNQEMIKGGDDVMQTRGFFKWIQATAQAVEPVPELFRTPAGNIISGLGTGSSLFSEPQFVEQLKSVKQVYGSKQNLELYAGDDIVSTIDNFSRIDPNGQSRYTITQNASDAKISLMVSIYDCSFGRVHVVSDQFVRYNETLGTGETNAGALVQPDYWVLQFFEDMTQKDLPDDQGSGPTGWVRTVAALGCKNPKGQGALYGV